MKKSFEIIDSQPSPIGEITLRRRLIQSLGGGMEVFEVKLGEEFLMSSLFHVAEEALARLGLGEVAEEKIDVVVGGLGLGYTAVAALESTRVQSLLVVEALSPVIGWHQAGKVPLGPKLSSDHRCEFVHGDFFNLNRSFPDPGFDPKTPGRRFHAILLDIDHSPSKVLHDSHAYFYQSEGLKQLALSLHPNGVFALWSDDPPEDWFMKELSRVFAKVRAEIVSFPNPLLQAESKSTVYIANL